MNPFPKVNPRCVKTGYFVPNWKSLDQTTKWTFLGMWDQADEALFQEMREGDASLKPRPNFAKVNPAMKQLSKDRGKARKDAARQSASYGKEGQ
jgi:hypothetical protein